MDDELNDLLDLEELSALRRDNPRALFRHLEGLKQQFLFGVEDHRDEDPPGWGGELRVLLNRNLTLHLVRSFNAEMSDREQLPQLCVLPNERLADQVEETSFKLDDGEQVRGVIFWVDPDEYDVLARDAGRVAEEFPGWDLIPDSYFLDSDLVQFITRVVLEHGLVVAEREFDFRLGLVGGTAPDPIDEEDLSPEQLIDPERGPDDDPPLEGMRSHPVEWGGGD